jgi:hypothetical protein
MVLWVFWQERNCPWCLIGWIYSLPPAFSFLLHYSESSRCTRKKPERHASVAKPSAYLELAEPGQEVK